MKRVVGAEKPATIAAFHTGVSVSFKYPLSPFVVLPRPSQDLVFGGNSTFPLVVAVSSCKIPPTRISVSATHRTIYGLLRRWFLECVSTSFTSSYWAGFWTWFVVKARSPFSQRFCPASDGTARRIFAVFSFSSSVKWFEAYWANKVIGWIFSQCR